MQHCLIHYGEIALKLGNRSFFERTLCHTLSKKIRDHAPLRIRRLYGRIWIEFPGATNTQTIENQLSKVFGLTNFIPCECVSPSLVELKQQLEKQLTQNSFSSFAVRAKRCEKSFPLSSQYINEEIGRFIQEKTGSKVDLENPEVTFYIFLFQERIFFGFKKFLGLGGLPVGIGGKVASLLSGGIDSPVAAWRMMKRGCRNVFIHFHSAPFVASESEDKALELAEVLAEYQNGALLFSVPFGETQRHIIARVPEEYRVLLYRRFMFRIAEKLAWKNNCKALVTGEALSQVASQTLSNLASIESVTTLPVLRPLIGMDKQEIVDEAKKIGTFEISTKPHADCCSFMVPKHPKTSSSDAELTVLEKDLEIDENVERDVKDCKRYDLG